MTIRMKKGSKFADIFNSPETIAQAQRDGYHICADEEHNDAEINPPELVTENPDEPSIPEESAAQPEESAAQPRRGRPPRQAGE